MATLLALGGLLALAGGCIVPQGSEVSAGYKFKDDTLAFLDLPGTTRQETIATLGEPLVESRENCTLVYEWETTSKWNWALPNQYGEVKLPEIKGTITRDAKRWVLLIAYDNNEMVCAHTIRHVDSTDWDQICAQWRQAEPTKPRVAEVNSSRR